MSSSACSESAGVIETVVPAQSTGFYERLVMLSLKQMRHGGLRMTMPDGTVCHLGNPEAAVTCASACSRWQRLTIC
jgi:hypothetical protein